MQENPFFQKYNYVRALGKGGCGEVYLAENKTLGNLWAVKEIPKDRTTTVSGYIEPEILKRLNHPALPRICDVYEDDSKIFLIEDYIEGISLIEELEGKGTFEEKTVIEWGIQLCSVLEYLHEQKPYPIIYGDMKPHNIILTKDGFIKLVDFGVSSVLQDTGEVEDSTKSTECVTAFIGTKGYAAPEQYMGAGISRRTDIYSLGITLIQLLTGIDPLVSIQKYYDGTYRQFMSQNLFKLLRRCIEPEPELRYQSIASVMKDLQTISLRNFSGLQNTSGKVSNLTSIIAFTGICGTGVSAVTAAAAQIIAKGPTKVCIVDLSKNGSLEISLAAKHSTNDPSEPARINFNMYYINLSKRHHVNNPDQFETLSLYKSFSQLQNRFSYIFIDSDISSLKYIQQFTNNIFFISDMNPYNLAELGQKLLAEEITYQQTYKTTFIINKFYTGELRSERLLQSILYKHNHEHLRLYLQNSRVFEIPYDQNIYISWMYSFFGEPFRTEDTDKYGFRKAISVILSETIHKEVRSRHNWLNKFRSCLGGTSHKWVNE